MSAAIAAMLDRIPWTPLDPPVVRGAPYPTHEGYLRLGNRELRVFLLSSGMHAVDPMDLSTSGPLPTAHRGP